MEKREKKKSISMCRNPQHGALTHTHGVCVCVCKLVCLACSQCSQSCARCVAYAAEECSVADWAELLNLIHLQLASVRLDRRATTNLYAILE